MAPDQHLPDGSFNPAWFAWASQGLAGLGQSAGLGMEVGGSFGIQLTEPEAESHWVRVTEVDDSQDPPRHAVEEVFRDPSTGEDAYQWEVRPGGLVLALPEDWAVEAAGGTAAVDDVVLVRKEAGGLWTFALGGGTASDWKPYRITGRTAAVRVGASPPHAPPLYQGVEVQLVADEDGGEAGNQLGWIDKTGGDSFDQGIRMPNKDVDEDHEFEVLLPIPVGQTVMARPSPDLEGYYEVMPWGGTRKTVIRHVHYVCGQCVDDGGIKKLRIKTASKMIAEIARDRRALWMPSTEAEVNVEDNTADTIEGL